MTTLEYSWRVANVDHALGMVAVSGTDGEPYLFGEENRRRAVDIPLFLIATTAVTQALWKHVMGDGSNASIKQGDQHPVENISWVHLTREGGFFDRINAASIRSEMENGLSATRRMIFRLPSETEWEYAARGGPQWRDALRFSGGDDINSVGWYRDNSGDRHHAVALKAPNQLGLHDMSGNIWEWCQDAFTRDVDSIPADGSAFNGPSKERVLRGGCFHNWAIHCTVSKRYEIAPESHDGCIGFRLVLAPA